MATSAASSPSFATSSWLSWAASGATPTAAPPIRALMLEAYDGGPQRVDRIKRGHVFVPNWSVVVAGNIQPRRLAGMAGT